MTKPYIEHIEDPELYQIVYERLEAEKPGWKTYVAFWLTVAAGAAYSAFRIWSLKRK